MSTRKEQFITLLNSSLSPSYLYVVDESHMHNVPPSSASHFKIVMVSTHFETMTRIQRHRKLNQLLSEHFEQGLHALSMHLYTPQEWQEKNEQANASPRCMGGKSRES